MMRSDRSSQFAPFEVQKRPGEESAICCMLSKGKNEIRVGKGKQMRFDEVWNIVGNVPFISKPNAQYLFELITTCKLAHVLELGIAHGTATCCIAAALEEIGGGTVTSVDLEQCRQAFRPSPEEQLQAAGLAHLVQLVRMKTGYTWFLHDDICRNTVDGHCRRIYDLCIIDGPKNWTIDGAAFFMVDKLLKEGGWLIFDDFHWTYADADNRRYQTDGITHRELSDDERSIPHVREIYDLLVRQHGSYSRFSLLNGRWGIAQRVSLGPLASPPIAGK